GDAVRRRLHEHDGGELDEPARGDRPGVHGLRELKRRLEAEVARDGALERRALAPSVLAPGGRVHGRLAEVPAAAPVARDAPRRPGGPEAPRAPEPPPGRGSPGSLDV